MIDRLTADSLTDTTVLPETPRWLLTHGKFKELERLLLYAAKKNNKDLPNAKLEIKNFIAHHSRLKNSKSDEAATVIDLIKPAMVKKTGIIFFTWKGLADHPLLCVRHVLQLHVIRHSLRLHPRNISDCHAQRGLGVQLDCCQNQRSSRPFCETTVRCDVSVSTKRRSGSPVCSQRTSRSSTARNERQDAFRYVKQQKTFKNTTK